MSKSSNSTTEATDRWSWVERAAWTDRMLMTLETGVRGGKWYSLYDKVHAPGNLDAAWRRVRANQGAPGIDAVTIEQYQRQLEHHQEVLQEQLRTRTYHPLPNRRKWIDKAGSKEQRPLGIPCVRDRIAQGALRQVLEPIFEMQFAEHSYGFRPGRSCKDALGHVDRWLREGWTHVVDADLKSYFDTIDHPRLLRKVREHVSDGRVLKLISRFLKQGVLEENGEVAATTEGTPQGGVISPLLSNIYLNDLDHLIAGYGWRMVRYADDFVVLCQSAAEAARALQVIAEWTTENALVLHPSKTQTVDMTERGAEFAFLGYRFRRNLGDGRLKRLPVAKAEKKLKDSLRSLTGRTNGNSLEAIIQTVNSVVRGWYEYYQHCTPRVWPPLDAWLRRRLRSILRKRSKRQGISKGHDHFRWPNAFFLEHGLFSLERAHAEAIQSLRGTR